MQAFFVKFYQLQMFAVILFMALYTMNCYIIFIGRSYRILYSRNQFFPVFFVPFPPGNPHHAGPAYGFLPHPPLRGRCAWDRESPAAAGTAGLSQYAVPFLKTLLADALREHRICNLFKACDICARHIVAFHIISLCSVVNVMINVYHDLL